MVTVNGIKLFMCSEKTMKEQAKKWFMKGWLCGKAVILQDLDYYFEQIWEEGIDREI